MAGTLSAPNPIKDIYKKLVFFDADSPSNPYEFQYTNAITLEDIPIANVKNHFIFDNQIKFEATVVGPTTNYTYPMDMTQLAADIYGGAQPSAGDHLPNLGGISSTHWSITNGSLIECLIGEKTDRVAKDTELDNELNQIERLITGSSTGWAHDDYQAAGQTQNPYLEGAGGALRPATQYIDNGVENITGNAADGLIDADQILDQEIHHNRTWLETLQNLWDGTDGAGTAPSHPSGNGANNNTVGTYNNTLLDIGTSAQEIPKYIADSTNTNEPRPGTGNTTIADATSIKDALLKLDAEIHKNETWLSEIHEALYGADDILDNSGGNVVGETPRDNVLQFDAATKVTFREFGSGKDHDSWGRHGNSNSGSYLTKDLAAVGTSTEGPIGRVNSFSQAIAELDYQIKNLWDRRDLDYNGFIVSQGAQNANAARISLAEIVTDLNSFCTGIIGTDLGDRNSSLPTYTPTVGNTYTGGNSTITLREQVDNLDAQLQHLTDAVQNSDTAAVTWSSDVGAGASILEDINSLHSELDSTQAGAGLNTDGSYTPPGGSYTGGNTTIKEDITDIEDRLDVLDGLITGSPNSNYSTNVGNTGDGALESDINWIWDTVWDGGGSAGTHSMISRIDEIISVSTGSREIKFNQNVQANNKQIKNMAAGTATDDAVTYGQLQLAQAGFTPGYAARVVTTQIADATSLMADTPSQTGTNPEGGLMAIDTSHTLANYNALSAKTWTNKGNITINGTSYEHGGIAYDANLTPKTITSNAVYIDGIEMQDGDYVLVAGESLAVVDGATWRESTQTGELGWHWRNGIWIFHDSGTNGGVWERPPTDILWEAGTGVGLGQMHPIREGYQNGLTVYESCAATVGPSDPAYPIESCETETQANAEALYGSGRVVSAWCQFTGIQAIGSGNATSVKNSNEVWIDYDTDQFQIASGSPDYLQIKMIPGQTAYGQAGTDLIPLQVDVNGIGLQVDNDFFEFDTGSGVNRLTLKTNQPVIGENMNLNAGGLVYNTSGYANKMGLGTNTPDADLHILGTSHLLKLESTAGGNPLPQLEIVGNTGGGSPHVAANIGLVSNTDYRGKGITMSNADDNDTWFMGNPYETGSSELFQVGYHNDATTPLPFEKDNSLFVVNQDGNAKVGMPGEFNTIDSYNLSVIDNTSPSLALISKTSNNFDQGGIYLLENDIAEFDEVGAFGFAIQHINTGAGTGQLDNALEFNSTSNGSITKGIRLSRNGNVDIGGVIESNLAHLHVHSTGGTIDITDTSDSGAVCIGSGAGQRMMMSSSAISSAAGTAPLTMYLNNYGGGKVKIGGTGDANLGIGINPSANQDESIKISNDSGGANANYVIGGSVSSGYTTNIYMDDTALKIGHTSTVRDIHIKCDDDGTPKGIEVESSGNLKAYGEIYEAGTKLSELYGDVEEGTKIPTGAIMLWSGSSTTVPTGWALCNGSNGTPDLQGRFVVGSNTDSGSTYDIGDAGGSNMINLSISQMPAHSHSLTSHSHDLDHSHSFNVSNHTHGLSLTHSHEADIGHNHNVISTGSGTTGASRSNVPAHSHARGTYQANVTVSSVADVNTGASNVGTLNRPTGGAHSHNMAHTHTYNHHNNNVTTGFGGSDGLANANTATDTSAASSDTTTSSNVGTLNRPTGGSHSHTIDHGHNGVTANWNGVSSNANITLNNHTHSTPNHSHNINSLVSTIDTSDELSNVNTTGVAGGQTSNTSTVNAASQMGGAGSTSIVGSGANIDARPPYYALAYIMKT